MTGNLVLLTGATGMIGFKTLVELLESGYTVRAAVRNQAGFDRISSLPPVQKYKPQLTSFIVPDITVPGAYDEAVKGAEYIVHAASPIPAAVIGPQAHGACLIRPAVQGTVGILESALRTTGTRRVVITASVVSIVSPARLAAGKVIDGKSHPVLDACPQNTFDVATEPPFADDFAAYAASKALAYRATKDFVAANNPPFDVVNIMPIYVFGRDETVTEASSIAKGSNSLIMGPLLGHARDRLVSGEGVHVDDVARMHVLALDPQVAGNQDFLAASPGLGGVDWTETFEIVKRRYPKEYADGVFNFDGVADQATPSPPARVDSAKATRVLGIQFKTFEEQVVSVVDHFLELTGRK
ncbi:reductase [Metarhizium album ARSEF 1941]|uniref:Reductase n=1 Tax=Metarhizium album (strain ARSEF 1941) TaxID=1081103 RepID=A0A0B2X0H5_METAS|nr:reductase [Metarhizium album ARSEF 1941]KHN99773.1 reductase [Metarhizium album ARSEF 1941]